MTLLLLALACGGEGEGQAEVSPDADADGWSLAEGDCDDGDASVHPAAAETCDDRDEDCDDVVDEGGTGTYFPDRDRDGHGDAAAPEVGCPPGDDWTAVGDDCDDTDAAVHPGAEEQWYDGIDQDCDGASDYDADGDGHEAAGWGDDADDADPTVW